MVQESGAPGYIWGETPPPPVQPEVPGRGGTESADIPGWACSALGNSAVTHTELSPALGRLEGPWETVMASGEGTLERGMW
jgi:hypothetical protein